MEKKNTILLTVIAIATLLVAVVGATFAYFTAQVKTDGDVNEGTTNVKTYTLASAVMDRGNDVSSEGVYPGTTIVKPLVITGDCADANGCQNVNSVIEVTANIPTEFGEDVVWTLYKGTTANPTGEGATPVTNEITCEVANNTTTGKYYAESTCTGISADKKVISSADTATTTTTEDGKILKTVTKDVVVTGTTNDTYYLVVEYKNKVDTTTEAGTVSGAQNTQQGKTFTVSVDFKSKA